MYVVIRIANFAYSHCKGGVLSVHSRCKGGVLGVRRLHLVGGKKESKANKVRFVTISVSVDAYSRMYYCNVTVLSDLSITNTV